MQSKNDVAALIEGSTTVGTYPGTTLSGYSIQTNYFSSAQMIFQTYEKIMVSLHSYKDAFDT
jgi:hypothetical protein